MFFFLPVSTKIWLKLVESVCGLWLSSSKSTRHPQTPDLVSSAVITRASKLLLLPVGRHSCYANPYIRPRSPAQGRHYGTIWSVWRGKNKDVRIFLFSIELLPNAAWPIVWPYGNHHTNSYARERNSDTALLAYCWFGQLLDTLLLKPVPLCLSPPTLGDAATAFTVCVLTPPRVFIWHQRWQLSIAYFTFKLQPAFMLMYMLYLIALPK